MDMVEKMEKDMVVAVEVVQDVLLIIVDFMVLEQEEQVAPVLLFFVGQYRRCQHELLCS